MIEGYFDRSEVEAEVRGQARTSMDHPLLLRFFSEAYAGEAVGRVNHVSTKEPFAIYLVRKRSEIARRLQLTVPQAIDEFLKAVGRVLWATEKTPLPEAFDRLPHGGLNPVHGSLYAALLETQILVALEQVANVRRITFKYAAFQAFITI